MRLGLRVGGLPSQLQLRLWMRLWMRLLVMLWLRLRLRLQRLPLLKAWRLLMRAPPSVLLPFLVHRGTETLEHGIGRLLLPRGRVLEQNRR